VQLASDAKVSDAEVSYAEVSDAEGTKTITNYLHREFYFKKTMIHLN